MRTTVLWTSIERCALCGHPERLIIASADGITSRCYVCGDVKIRRAEPTQAVELVGSASRPAALTGTGTLR